MSHHVTREGFAVRLLKGLGAPNCYENRVAMLAWMACENTRARNNPLATTMPYPRATEFNSAGVKNYATLEDGIQATLKTIRLGYYKEIRARLAKCARAEETARAIWQSPWGTGRCVEQIVPRIRKYYRDYASKFVSG